jgi:hypothetical protein
VPGPEAGTEEVLVFRRFVPFFIVTAALILVLPHSSAAQVTPAAGYTPPDNTQSIGIGAVVFYDYTFTNAPKSTDSAGNAIHANAFNVGRTYLNVTGRLNSFLAFRITPDVTRETGSGSSLNGSLLFRLKYGYAQMNLDQWTGGWKSSYVRIGIQQTPFIDAEESVYRYRFQGTVFAERDGGMASSDGGVSFHTNLPGNYGDIHAGIYNGEGYSKVEPNDQKAVAIRGTVRPLAAGGAFGRGLRVTGYYYGDHVVQDADRRRAMGSVWLEQPHFNIGFDYINRSDEASATAVRIKSDGYSIFVTPFFKRKGDGLEALIRYDSFRPDSSLDARQNRTIAGLAYWFPHPGGNATAALLLDFEQVKFKSFTTPQPTQQRIALHGLINF